MITVITFLAAAAVGTVLRSVVAWYGNREGRLPLGTLAVNITGAFLLGVLSDTAPPALTVLGTGALGAYTTFSTFAREVVVLAGRKLSAAALYVALTCGLGVAAAAIGVAVAP